MLLAVWHPRGAPPWLETRLPHSRSNCSRFELEKGALWATAPGCLEHGAHEGVAWLYPSPPVAPGAEAPGPDLRLTAHGLEVTSGPLPQHPLYYYRAPDDSVLTVCSELELLLPLIPSAAIDARRLVSLMAWQLDAEPGATPFIAIRRLRACEHLRADGEGVRSTTRVPRAGRSYLRARPEDLAAELRERLDAAVGRAMGTSERVAVHVGGGLDSSGVLALAVARSRGAGTRDVQALAEVWACPGDDGPHLAALENALGIVALRLRASEAGPWFTRSLCTDAQPQVFSAACGDMLLSATSRLRGADATLTGHGGDIVCGGDLSFAPLILAGQPVRAVVDALRLQVPRDLDIAPLRRLSRWIVRPLLAPLARSILPRGLLLAKRRRGHKKPWLTPRFIELLSPAIAAVPPTPETPDEWMAHLCAHPLFAALSVSWGQIASITGVAPVDVFRDLDLVRFVAQIDPMVLSHGHSFRGLYRLAMKGILPESVRLRRDKALGQPFVAAAAMAAGATGFLQDLSSLDRLASLDLVDPDAFRSLFAAWLRALRRGERVEVDATDRSWNMVWSVLSCEAFLRGIAARGHGDTRRWPG